MFKFNIGDRVSTPPFMGTIVGRDHNPRVGNYYAVQLNIGSRLLDHHDGRGILPRLESNLILVYPAFVDPAIA